MVAHNPNATIPRALEFELLKSQAEFLSSDAEIIIYRAGIRSGKTFVGAIKTIKLLTKGENVLAISGTYSQVMAGIVSTMIEVCNLFGLKYQLNKSEKWMRVGRGIMFFRSAENPDNGLRGFKAAHLWVDEGSYLPEYSFNVALGRLSVKTKRRQVYITSSPNGRDWVYRVSKQENAHLIKQSLRDNYFLDQQFIDLLSSQYTGEWAKQEIDGEIIDQLGAIYDTTNLVFDDIRIGNGKKIISWDLGFSERKTSDYSAYSILEWDGDTLFVHEAKRFRFIAPKIQKRIIEVTRKWGYTTLIEGNGPQKGVFDNVQYNDDYGDYIRICPSRAKVTRHIPLSSLMEAGKIVISNEIELKDELRDEFADFTADDSHDSDDMIDNIAQGMEWYTHKFVTDPLKSVRGI